MNQLAKSYARVYLNNIKKDIELYGKKKALKNWTGFKKELKSVHNDLFILEIEKEFKKMQESNKS